MRSLDIGHTRALIDECAKQRLLRNQCAYVLATALWETARTMEPVKEAYWLGEEWRKTHLRYYPWYGRGFVQLTWQKNYRAAGEALGVDLITNPDRALDWEIAKQVAVMGMRTGLFTGKKLSDYITLQRSDFGNARRIINGTDKAGEIAAIAKEYDAALRAEGYGNS